MTEARAVHRGNGQAGSVLFLGLLGACAVSARAAGAAGDRAAGAGTSGHLELPTQASAGPRGAFELTMARELQGDSHSSCLVAGCRGLLRAERFGPFSANGAEIEPFVERRGERGELRLSAGVTRALALGTWRSTESVAVRGALRLRTLRLELSGRTTFVPPRSWQEAGTTEDPDSVRRGLTPPRITRTRPGAASTDGTLEVRWQGELWTVGAQGGVRFGLVDRASRFAGRVLAERWVASHLSVIAHAGWSPASLELGLPARRTGGVALKVAWNEPRLPRALACPVRRPLESFSVRTVDHDVRVLRLLLPSASVVEMSADFTEWQAVALTRRGDAWEARLPIKAGVHRLSVRVDHGPWTAPPGLVPLSDGFGGSVGTLCLP